MINWLKYSFILAIVLMQFKTGSGQEDIAPPEIISVSVDPETGDVTIQWKQSSTPSITYYKVMYTYISGVNQVSVKEVPGGRIPVSDSIFYYIDPYSPNSERDATKHSVGYSVQACLPTNKCSESDVSEVPKDSTIFAASSFDSCNSAITLEWNDYNSWRGNIYGYRIYQSTGNGGYSLVNTVPEGTNTIDITNVQADTNYNHYVVAIRDNVEKTESSSNRTEVSTVMARPPDHIHAISGTYISNNAAEVQFGIEGDPELTTYNLLRATDPSGPFEVIQTFSGFTDSLLTYTDNIDYYRGPYYYQLNSINYCDQVARVSENTAGTILLNGSNEGHINQLAWNRYENWLNGVESYEVSRKFGDEDYEIIANSNQTNYTDDLSALINTTTSGSVCYSLRAIENSGGPAQAQSISNEWCTQLPLNIRFEFDAFVPDNPGGNNTFGPTIDFLPDEILFQIFNRWGEVVYESKDPYNLRWNGHINNSPAPEGVYVYFLYAKNKGNKPLKMRGNVTVAYP